MGIKITGKGTRTEFIPDLTSPTNFATGVVDANSVPVTWTAPAQGTAIGYKVYDAVGTLRGQAIWPSTGFTVQSLPYETTHTLHVVTYDPTTESAASNTDTAIIGVNLAKVFFEDNFETGTFTAGVPSPILQMVDLDSITVAGSVSNNIWTVDNTQSHSGTYSLKFDFESRNGIANIAITGEGLNLTEDQLAGHDGVDYFISSLGTDLSILNSIGDVLYDYNGQWSMWDITGFASVNATNDKALLTLRLPAIDGGTSVINGGDSCVLTPDPATLTSAVRRSDYNSGIASLFNPTPAEFLLGGESYFKRYYFYSDMTVVPDNHLKAAYFGESGGNPQVLYFGATDNTANTQYFKLDHDNIIADLVDVLDKTWYYVEIEYQNSSTDLAADGAMRLWIREAGSEPTDALTPDFEFLNVDNRIISNGARITIWGNIQHWNNSSGVIHIDDLILSDTFNGAA